MKKLTLKLEELAVDSFTVAEDDGPCGTVLAHGFEETGPTGICCPTFHASCRLCPVSDITQCDCPWSYENGNC